MRRDGLFGNQLHEGENVGGTLCRASALLSPIPSRKTTAGAGQTPFQKAGGEIQAR